MSDKWRVIITDSENLDGVAPVCPNQNDYTKHSTGDGYMKEPADDVGVYGCCPYPQIEGMNERQASALVEVLNAAYELSDLNARFDYGKRLNAAVEALIERTTP